GCRGPRRSRLRQFRRPQGEERARAVAILVLQVVEGDRDLDQALERRPLRLRRAEPDRLEELVDLEEQTVIRERRRPVEKGQQTLAVAVSPVADDRRRPRGTLGEGRAVAAMSATEPDPAGGHRFE